MRNLSIRYQFMIPVGIVMMVIIVATVWAFVQTQSEKAQAAFASNLETIAVTSCLMMHTSAEEYARQHELAFHRVLAGSLDTSTLDQKLGAEAIRVLSGDHTLQSYSREVEDTSGTRVFVFAAARIKDECNNCHGAYGLDTFNDRKDGDLVAAFGVSGSTASLRQEQAEIIRVALVMGLAILAALGGMIFLFVSRIVVSPLRVVAGSTAKIAGGDLAARVPLDSRDELGQLGAAFNGMAGKLRETMMGVGEAAEAVSSAVTEISASAEEMAAGAMEQSNQAGAVASAVEQMAKSIVENSRNAKQAAEAARKAKQSAEDGGTVVARTVDGMKRISSAVHRSADAVKELGKSGDRIGEIVSVIDDIADQTNLLALNAAIEAARVGEAGRGFAVVADEVRKLADRTTGATKEIAQMIREIQTQTAGAVTTMDVGTREVEDGITLADQAGAALMAIVENSAHLTETVTQIASASAEQSKTSEMISESAEAITRVIGETSQGTNQIARATEDLNRLTERLRTAISFFRLGEERARSEEKKTGHGAGSSLSAKATSEVAMAEFG